MDINLATNQVSQRLKSIYGEDFSLDNLEEDVSLELIKNEIINQKTLLSHARKLGLIVSEKKAKQEIIKIDKYSVEWDSSLNKCFAGYTIRAIEGVSDTITVSGEAKGFFKTSIDTRVYFIKNY